MRKLYFCNFGPTTLQQFLVSYLSNRKQIVHYNGTTSATRELNLGVPQGSILDPLLFLVYVNDLNVIVDGKAARLIPYADDTVIVSNGTSLEDLL